MRVATVSMLLAALSKLIRSAMGVLEKGDPMQS